MAFQPSLKKKRQFEETEINMAPIMNLICILIPLLLSTAKFVDIALLQYTPPLIESVEEAEGEGSGGQPETSDLLELHVNVADDAIEVSIFNQVSGEYFSSVPRKSDGNYDFKALRSKLVEIKEKVVGPPISQAQEFDQETGKMITVNKFKYSDASQIRISALDNVPLQVIISALDASREYRTSKGVFRPLFPASALGQFQ